MEGSSHVLLLTGLSSYLGTHIAKQLLERLPADFKFKATVRDKSNLSKLKVFIEEVGEEQFKRIELVDMDLTKPETIGKALEGATHVIHVASPINPSEFAAYEAFVNPVVEGTKALVEAMKQHHTKKLVVTSSCLCIIGEFEKKVDFDESDFTPLTHTEGYTDSKIHEELILLDFIKSQEGQANATEVVIVNGALIFGPPILSTSFSSIQLVGAILQGMMPAVAQINVPVCDVRDVAEAHVTAALKEGLHGQRIAICQDVISFVDVAKILHNNFAKHGYPVTQSVKADKEGLSPMQQKMFGVNYTISNKKSKELLGIKYERTVEQSLVDMVLASAKYGLVENKIPA